MRPLSVPIAPSNAVGMVLNTLFTVLTLVSNSCPFWILQIKLWVCCNMGCWERVCSHWHQCKPFSNWDIQGDDDDDDDVCNGHKYKRIYYDIGFEITVHDPTYIRTWTISILTVTRSSSRWGLVDPWIPNQLKKKTFNQVPLGVINMWLLVYLFLISSSIISRIVRDHCYRTNWMVNSKMSTTSHRLCQIRVLSLGQMSTFISWRNKQTCWWWTKVIIFLRTNWTQCSPIATQLSLLSTNFF